MIATAIKTLSSTYDSGKNNWESYVGSGTEVKQGVWEAWIFRKEMGEKKIGLFEWVLGLKDWSTYNMLDGCKNNIMNKS